MHIWIDINRTECAAFTKALVNELNKRGHKVTITAQNSSKIRDTLNKHNLDAKAIGFVFSLFGLFEEHLNMIRSSQLGDYILSKNIDVAFSMGSAPLFYTCFWNKLPMILFLENKNQKINHEHFIFDKICFIVPNAASEQFLIEKGYNPKSIQRYKGHLEPFCDNPSPILIKEVADQIECLGASRDLTA